MDNKKLRETRRQVFYSEKGDFRNHYKRPASVSN